MFNTCNHIICLLYLGYADTNLDECNLIFSFISSLLIFTLKYINRFIFYSCNNKFNINFNDDYG